MPSVATVIVEPFATEGTNSMHRRRFGETVTSTSLASALIRSSALTQQKATPGATPVQDNQRLTLSLAELVAEVTPQSLLDALLATSVTTPLFPADTPPIEPVVWDDTSDSDLDGTVGAVVFNTGYDENDNFLPVGNAIMFPNAASASARIDNLAQDPISFLEMPWTVEASPDSVVSAIRVDYLILVGGAEVPTEQVLDARGEPDPRQGAHMTSRAIIHMTALTDHLRVALAGIEG